MGGHDHAKEHASAGGHGHGHGEHGHGHGHGHHGPHVPKGVISYHIPDPAHEIETFKAPDWRVYKVENAPSLVRVRDTLAARGLKDPWLRNEVWRYDAQFGMPTNQRQIILRNASMGMKWGLILAVGTALLETGYNKLSGKEDHHHGHH